MPLSNRRRFLLAACGVPGMTGCTSILPESPPEGIALSHVDLRNYSDEPRVFDLLVEIDGQVVHWDSHEVPEPYSGPNFERESVAVDMDEPGAVTLRARVDDQQAHVDFTGDPSVADLAGECVIGLFSYDPRGEGELVAHPRATLEENCPALAEDD